MAARSPEGLASALGALAHRPLGEDRSVTLARYVLRADVRRAGSRHPERDSGIAANYVTGLVLDELALPTPDLDHADRDRDLMGALGWSAP